MFDSNTHSKLVLKLALFLTVSIAVVKGGVPEWASMVWLSLCIVSFYIAWAPVAFSFKNNKEQVELPVNYKELPSRPLFILTLFQAWVVIQYFLVSLDKPASLDQLLVSFGILSLLMVWKFALKERDALNLLFYTVLCFAVIQAVYGLWIYISGINMLLWMPKTHYLDRPTGFFVNGNHFAAYTYLAITLCISRMLIGKKKGRGSLMLAVFSFVYNPQILVLLLLVVALIASKSIGAITALGVVLCLMVIHLICRSKQRVVLTTVIVAFFSLFIAAFLSLDYSVIDKELSLLSHTFSRRYALSDAAMGMLKETWLWGIGGGSFYSQFSQYRTLDIGNAYYNFAHNDLIQFWVEYGLIGIVLLGLFLVYVLRDNITILNKKHTEMQAVFAYTSIYSTMAVMVHSLVDFPMHIPGFSVCYLVIISANSLTVKKNSMIASCQ